MLLFFLACTQSDPSKNQDTAQVAPIDWTRGNSILSIESTSIRAIVHLHSHHSHDACDGEPQPDGIPDEHCLGDLREALCEVRIDVAFLSDHPTHSTEVEDFDELFLHREGDTWLSEGGSHIANQINCENGHAVWIFPGVESAEMMPLGLREHIDGGYDGSPEAVAAVQAQNAINWIAHTEQVSVERLLSQEIEGVEIYQLHANLDPDIRQDYLGEEPFDYVQYISPFFFPTPEMTNLPEPDLAFLAFVLPNEPALNALEQAGMTRPLGVSAGTDAHQNVFPNLAPDGERIDSYRRMMRWFNTRIAVSPSASPLEVHQALKNRQTWIALEIVGEPIDFEMTVNSGSQTWEMGSEMTLIEGSTLHIALPTLSPSSPQGNTAPNIEGRLYHYDGAQRQLLHTWSDGTELDWPLTETGVYRAEVWIQPKHLEPYLGSYTEYADKWVPWIYSGAFFLR